MEAALSPSPVSRYRKLAEQKKESTRAAPPKLSLGGFSCLRSVNDVWRLSGDPREQIFFGSDFEVPQRIVLTGVSAVHQVQVRRSFDETCPLRKKKNQKHLSRAIDRAKNALIGSDKIKRKFLTKSSSDAQRRLAEILIAATNLDSNQRDFPPAPKVLRGNWLSGETEEQTVGDFVKRASERGAVLTKEVPLILILPCGLDSERSLRKRSDGSVWSTMDPKGFFLSSLRDYVAAFFDGCEVRLAPEYKEIRRGCIQRENPDHPGQQKRQLHVGDVLKKELIKMKSQSSKLYALMGITYEDIYPCDGWNFMAGMTDTKSRTGICSIARYRIQGPAAAFEPMVDAKLLKRSCRVVTHELCHAFQMKHCVHFNCLIQGSQDWREAEERFFDLCPVCLQKLFLVTGGRVDMRKRYIELERWIQVPMINNLSDSSQGFCMPCEEEGATGSEIQQYFNLPLTGQGARELVFGEWGEWCRQRKTAIDNELLRERSSNTN